MTDDIPIRESWLDRFIDADIRYAPPDGKWLPHDSVVIAVDTSTGSTPASARARSKFKASEPLPLPPLL